MTTIVTVDGDTLDEIIVLHYGAEVVSAALTAVLRTVIDINLPTSSG